MVQVIIHLLFLCCFNTGTDSVPLQLNLILNCTTLQKRQQNMFFVEGSEGGKQSKTELSSKLYPKVKYNPVPTVHDR